MSIFDWFRKRSEPKKKLFQAVDNRGGWYRIFEPFTGAWQQNISIDKDTILTYSAVYACITLIAQDIGKLRLKLVQQQSSGIWKEVQNPAFSPVLRKPNRYQTRVKFFEHWIASKLIHGNAYAVKVRDARGVVQQLYILDPQRVAPLVSDDGSVFYRLKSDNLGRLPDDVIVPAREIIHDPMVTLFHPLVGVSPLTACGLAALQGLRIQSNSTSFFGNNSTPGGIITAPGNITDADAATLKTRWEAAYGGGNSGKVAVLGDGLKFEQMAVNATDAQLIEQLKWTAETVCSCFHIPPYMIGVGPMPAYNNIQALTQHYYSMALQPLIENLEISLDEGLEMVSPTLSLGTEFNLKDLLRMDTATRFKTYADGVGAGVLAPNDARIDEDLEPAEGGDTPYLQQQQFSLAALAERDSDKPFSKPTSATPALPAPAPSETDEERQARWFRKSLNALSAELGITA